jgi:DAPG hydrolase PhiG domain
MTSTFSALATPELESAETLLDPGPLAIEMGVQRLASGQLHVAARTDMPACRGRMLEWWFRFAPDTRQYAWWHPLDHVCSTWRETSPHTHIGSTHLVEERLGGSDEIYALQIHFVDPGEIFGSDAVEQAKARGDVSAIVAAQIGIGPEPLRDDRGRPNMGRMAHIARDAPDGMVLRSRFWLGAGTGLPPEQLANVIPDVMGLQLMQHAHTEFKYLSRFLPSLYSAENREQYEVALPW